MAAVVLKATLSRFGRLGFVGALLLALATVALPAEGRACVSGVAEAALMALDTPESVQTNPCDAEGCGDCDAICAHGCCHASHLGVIARPGGPLAPTLVSEVLLPSEPVATRLTFPSRLERPPRG